jgi:hypothetical protein
VGRLVWARIDRIRCSSTGYGLAQNRLSPQQLISLRKIFIYLNASMLANGAHRAYYNAWELLDGPMMCQHGPNQRGSLKLQWGSSKMEEEAESWAQG